MLVAVLLTLAVAAAVPMLGVGIGLGLTPVCVVAESAVAAAPARGPEAVHAVAPAGQCTLAAPRAADVALALRAAILPHTTVLPPPTGC